VKERFGRLSAYYSLPPRSVFERRDERPSVQAQSIGRLPESCGAERDQRRLGIRMQQAERTVERPEISADAQVADDDVVGTVLGIVGKATEICELVASFRSHEQSHIAAGPQALDRRQTWRQDVIERSRYAEPLKLFQQQVAASRRRIGNEKMRDPAGLNPLQRLRRTLDWVFGVIQNSVHVEQDRFHAKQVY